MRQQTGPEQIGVQAGSDVSKSSLAGSFFKCLFWLAAATFFGASAVAQGTEFDWVVNTSDIGSDPTVAGGYVTYEVSVNNNTSVPGQGPAPATTVEFTVPANGLMTEVTNTTCDQTLPLAAGETVTCDIPSLGEDQTFNLDVVIQALESGAITLAGEVATENDTAPANNTIEETTTILNGADVALSIDGPPEAVSGEMVTYTFTALNNGPDTVIDAMVEIPAIAGLNVTDVPSFCAPNGGGYMCEIPQSIADDDSFEFDVTGQVLAAGSGSSLIMTGTIDVLDPSDPLTDDNSDTLTTSVSSGSDVQMSKSNSAPSTVLVGDPVVFTLSPTFTGGVPAGLALEDVVPSGYQIDEVEVISGGWVCDVAGQALSCARTSDGLTPGSDVSLGEILIRTTAVTAGGATNTATISSTGPEDPNADNNSDTDGGRTLEDPVVDLGVTKDGPDPALVVIGNEYDFRLRTRNTGNADFYGTLVMVDSLPAGMTFTGYEGNGWVCSPVAPQTGPVDVTCELDYEAGERGALAPGAQTPVATITVEATASGTLTNEASVSSPDYPGVGGNTSFEVTGSSEAASADISVVKTAAPGPVLVGDVQTFFIEVRNTGSANSADVTVTDALNNLINNQAGPTGAGLVSVTEPAGADCSSSANGGRGRQLSCEFDVLEVCTPDLDCPVIEVQVRPGGNGGTRSNTAQALSTAVADPDLTNNVSTAQYELDARTDVTVTKVANPGQAIAGQQLTYVVTAQSPSNPQSLSAAPDTTITDVLPDGLIFVSATPTAGSCSAPTPATLTAPGNNEVVCNFGTVSNGGQQAVEVVVQPTEAHVGQVLENTVQVSTSLEEIDSDNNEASVQTMVVAPVYDLQVNKSDNLDPIAVGDDVTYTVAVRNNGPSAADDVTVNDIMPNANLAYRSHDAGGATCSTVPALDEVGGTLSCTFDRIASGETRSVTITARGVAKGTATNTANLESDGIDNGYDSVAANNSVTENTTVRTRADMEVTSKVADPSTVELLEEFDFIVAVTNNTGSDGGVTLAEADNVEVTDSLPENMVLTGAPSVTSGLGGVTQSSCSGSAGGTSFTCSLGTFASGAVVEITVPVMVTATSSAGQVFTNAAEVSTSSLDVDPTNNENDGDVTVVSSTLSGTVYRDFDDDGVQDGGQDTGVGGVQMTLTGTAFDGSSVSRTVTTNADGTYSVPNLPRGDYIIERGSMSESFLDDGQSISGSAGGSETSATEITTISLGREVDATDYDFTLVPQARIGIAKRVTSGPTSAADGSFQVGFTFVVENFSLEALEDVDVTDQLDGPAPLFGSYANIASPADGEMARGTYTITAGPAGSCGGANGAFTGQGASDTLVTGVTIAAESTCTITLSLRVQPVRPLPETQPSGGVYENQAQVSGNGAVTGQTPADNPLLEDTSDNGADADPNANGQAGDAGEDDPTPVTPTYSSSIALVKTAVTAFSDPPEPGNTITYTYAITNTGALTLTNVTLADELVDDVLVGDPIPVLEPNETNSTAYTATYVLTQGDIEAGEVENTAEVTGTDPFDEEVTDTSGTAQDNDTPTVTPVGQDAAISLVKTADASGVSDPAAVGETITYSFTVTNTGNLELTDVTLDDVLPGIVWDTPNASIDLLAPGAEDSTTFSASYTLTQADLDAGVVDNTATVNGDSAAGEVDDSDDESVPLGQAPAIVLEKTVDNSGLTQTVGQVGEELEYTFTVTNTGTVTLHDVAITDPLLGSNQISETIDDLAPGDKYTFTETGIYQITQDDIDAGEVTNTATAEGTYGEDGNGGSLTVDDEDDAVAQTVFIEAVPEAPWEFDTDGGTTSSMLESDMYGTEPATLSNVTISVVDSDPELTLDPSTGLITLAPGNPAGTYEVTYEICRIDNPAVCDEAVETVVQNPIDGIEAVKTQELADNGDGVDGVGDVVTYAITVENLGNTPLTGVDLVDTFETLTSGQPLALDSGPSFVSASEGSSEGSLEIGEIATYTASFELTIEAVDGGGLSNQIEATATPDYPDEFPDDPDPVTDLSDDGDDDDGNTEDDPTVYPLEPLLYDSGMVLEKTTPRGVVERGSVVPYTITVTNRNPRTSGTMDLMDVLPSHFVYVEGSATWDGAPFDVRVQGKVVTWGEVRVPPLSSVVATLSARVLSSADPGDHVNRARLRDSSTQRPLSGEATATVSIVPEPVFDCGDVYGKVFNDLNRDGYQNAPRRPVIDDDAVFTGKAGIAPEVEREIVENGVPAVRLTGVDGTIITTDQHGRFHVPCAMLPEDRGSNFILKLDTRSLPTGYRLTTENPRVVRLTPGKMTELNFGVALTRVVRVDLNANAFVQTGKGTALAPRLEAALGRLVQDMAGEPIHLRLSYHLPGEAVDREDRRTARRALKLVERRVRRLWTGPGRVKLTIEKTIVRVEK